MFTSKPSTRALIAQQVVTTAVASRIRKQTDFRSTPSFSAPADGRKALPLPDVRTGLSDNDLINSGPEPQVDSNIPKSFNGQKVAIIGAGMAGLYTAMILESLNIKYELIEAADRPGGRIFTHYFDSDPKKYQYFDVGAMRFPKIPIMARTFDLFERVGIEDRLIKYIMNSDNTPLLYNGIRLGNSQVQPLSEDDYFHVSEAKGGKVPNEMVDKGYDNLIDAAFKEYKDALAENFDEGWKKLLKEDNYSTRAFMSKKKVEVEIAGKKTTVVDGLEYPYEVVQWCETMDSATGLYDEAFSEGVMDSLDFGYPLAKNETGSAVPAEKEVEWFCIDGGTSQLTNAMLSKIKQSPSLNTRLVSITNHNTGTGTPPQLKVTTVSPLKDQTEKVFDYVISSLPMSSLRQVDLDVHLDYEQKNAIRSLHYDASVKVGIQFECQWWRMPKFMGGGTIQGGKSSTDRAIRTCVYPSFGLSTSPESPGVLLASYTWAQDAMRLGALVHGKDSAAEKQLIQLVLRDLAVLHNISLTILQDLYRDHYAHDWYHDEFSAGAFALFGPGQFNWMYPAVTRPAAGGLLHFIGEATSVHHAWVVGSLDSAWRGVYNMLKASGWTEEEIEDTLFEKWGRADEVKTDKTAAWMVDGRLWE